MDAALELPGATLLEVVRLTGWSVLVVLVAAVLGALFGLMARALAAAWRRVVDRWR
jgi:hypothetical protein